MQRTRIGTSDEAREDWEFTGPHFDMEEVYSTLVDTRGDTPRLLVGASSSWLGPQVWRSDDLGATWQETPNGAVRFPDDPRLQVAGEVHRIRVVVQRETRLRRQLARA